VVRLAEISLANRQARPGPSWQAGRNLASNRAEGIGGGNRAGMEPAMELVRAIAQQ